MTKVESGVVLTDAEYKALTEKKKPKTSTVVLVALALFLLAFIVTMIVTFWVKGAVPDTLIQCTLGAGGVEAVALAGIKISKTMTERKEQPNEHSDP